MHAYGHTYQTRTSEKVTRSSAASGEKDLNVDDLEAWNGLKAWTQDSTALNTVVAIAIVG